MDDIAECAMVRGDAIDASDDDRAWQVFTERGARHLSAEQLDLVMQCLFEGECA